MKFGNDSQIHLMAAEVSGAFAAAPPEGQIELLNSLIDGCNEAVELGSMDPKVCTALNVITSMCAIGLCILIIFMHGVYNCIQGPLLDFFGVPVKANDLLKRVQELQLLAKRISRYEDPIAQFRVLRNLKPSNWSKGCGWNQSKCYPL